MAETIGRAYIKILADGSGMGESIRRELKDGDVDKAARQGGEDFSKSYAKGYEDEERKSKNFSKSLSRTLNKGFHEMNENAGAAGARAGKINADRMAQNIERRLRASFPDLDKVAGDLGKRMGESMRNDFILHGKFTKDFDAFLQQALKDQKRFEDQMNRDHAAAVRINETIDQRAHDEDMRRFREHAAALRENAAFDERVEAKRMQMLRLHTAALRIDAERERRITEERKKHGNAFIKQMDEMSDAIGHAFGKGSRNNFINFVGAFIGGIANIPGKLASVGLKIKNFGEELFDIFTKAPTMGAGFVGVLGKIVPAAGAAGIALIGLVSILGVATSALLLTAGAAAALVSTLAFGLVGAVAPLIGLLGPLGLAAGGVALAFIGMSDAAKDSLKEAFAPLKAELKALGNAARPGILDGITKAAENLEAPMKRLKPLMKVVGESVGTFIDTVSKVSFGPGFEKFVDVMSKTMPSTMKSLGTIFGNTFDGMMGLFATLQPFVEQFLDTSERISGSFADWSVSPEAANFFADAAESAGALMDFLGPVWNLIKEILGAGKDTGDSLFKSMGENIQGWVDALQANPDILKNFFADAKKMGEEIGNLIVKIGEFIDALDTETTRKWAIDLVKFIGTVIGWVTKLVGAWNKLPGVFQAIVTGIFGMMTAWKLFGGVARTAMGAMDSFTGGAARGEAGAIRFQTALRGLAGGAGIGLLVHGLSNGESAFGTFETIAGGAALGFSMGGPWGAAIGGTMGGLAALVKSVQASEEAVKQAGASASDSAGEWDTLTDSLNQVTGATTEATRAAIFDQLSKDKTMDQFKELGLSANTVVDALMGQPAAMREVEGALDTLDGQIADNVARYDELTAAMADVAADDPNNVTRLQALEEEREALGITIEQQKNLRESVDAEKESMDASAQAIRERAAAITDWGAKLKGFPKKVITEFEAGNIPDSMGKVRDLLSRYKGIRDLKHIKTLFSVLGIEKSDKSIKKMIEKLNAADKLKVKPTVEVKADMAEKTSKRVRNLLDSLNIFKSKPKIDADSTKFDQKNKDVKNKANETGKLNPKIKVDAQTDQASTDLTGIQTQVNNLPPSKTITITTHYKTTGKPPGTASGGIFAGAQTRIIGEAGPEAVVPLSRPLSQVDPAVRELSAIAQGMRFASRQQRPVSQRTIDVGGIQIITPTKDPGAVAQEMVNRLVAVGY